MEETADLSITWAMPLYKMVLGNVILALLTQADPSGNTVKVRFVPCRLGTVTLPRDGEKTTLLGMIW